MRIDSYLAEKFGSRTKSARAVEEGLVLVNGKTVSPSYEVKESDNVSFITAENDFVSVGGRKLNKALNDFALDVSGKIFADIGASTGGFTDCLLKRGAKKVYCIDVGESQLNKSLLNKNVVVIDNFNARNLNNGLFKENLDGVVADVSFISLTYILSGVSQVLNSGGLAVMLIKPQFELEKSCIGKNGIVKDAKHRLLAIQRVFDYASGCGLAPVNLTTAPEVKGKNKEFLVHLVKNGEPVQFNQLIKRVNL